MANGFPGLGGGEELPSGDPVLPGDLAGAFAGDTAYSEATAQQRHALLGGEMEQKMTVLLEGALTALATKALTQMERSGQQSEAITAIHEYFTGTPGASSAPVMPQTQPPAPPPSPATPTPQPQPAAPQTAPVAPQATPAEETYHPLQQFREGRERIQHMKMGEAVQAVAAPIARSLSERTSGWVEGTTSTGEPGMVRHASDGSGAIIDEVAQSDPKFSTMKLTMGLGGMATRVASGEGALIGRLGAASARIAGPIGLAVGGVQMAGGFVEGQIEKAAPYRAAFGEEAGTFAAGDRLGEFTAGLQGFGTIGGDRAREQFQQASAMGLSGERREGATDFASQMYMKFGMDTAQSMQIVEQTVKQGNVSLIDFSEAISNVSKAAVEAGRSSTEAIKDFTDAQAYVASNLVAGAPSVAAAEEFAGVTAGLPTVLADSLGGATGLAKSATPTAIMQAAAIGGQDPLEALGGMVLGQPGAPTNFIAQQGEALVAVVAPYVGMTPDQFKAAIAKATNGQTVSNEQQKAILLRMLGGDVARFGQMFLAMQSLAPQLGISLKDDAQLFNLLFEAASGGLGVTEEQQRQDRSGPIGRGVARAGRTIGGMFGSGGGGDATTGDYDKVTGAGADAQRQEILGNLGYKVDTRNSYLGGSMSPEDSKAFDAYAAHVAKTGRGNAQAEEMLSMGGTDKILEAAGTDDLDDVRYRMKVGGKTRDMSMAQIMSGGDKYMNKLDRATIVNTERPDEQPKSLKVVLDLSPDAKRLVVAQSGPSDDQRSGTPPTGSVPASDYPIYGGQ